MQHNKFTNRLIHEKSPYLLQHAHNPVDWYPWGQEAFHKAKELNRPIFLSIGYSTCHWCHVMEQESFEQESIAERLNASFINIKVDREELPEVDLIYIEFAQSMMSGMAGWPLNVILTPELEPFFAITYLPPYKKHGMIGLVDLIERIHEIWQSEERETLVRQAKKIVDFFSESIQTQGDSLPNQELVKSTAQFFIELMDPIYGGIKGAPKFPLGYQLNFLLREAKISNDSRSLFLVERTLDMIHRGGIYDHVGGGISRYSTDDRWLIPHFEKMLYDNAILIYSYVEAWRATKKSEFKAIAEHMIHYILREMTDIHGGFYSAEDADSEGREGLFYTWHYDEIIQLLGEKESEFFRMFYNITRDGHFEGRNILNTPQSLEQFSSQKNLDPTVLQKKFQAQLNTLDLARQKRIRPFKDDKILTSWNALMIFSLVEAGRAFNHDLYSNAAKSAANFIKENMWQEPTLFRRWRDGNAQYASSLDEYAFLIRALICLFEADYGTHWLRWALELNEILRVQFKSQHGAYYYTDGSNSDFILRKCQYADGSEPSGNAIHCENLLKLYSITRDPLYLEEAEDVLRAVNKYIGSYPPGYLFHMNNVIRYLDKNAPTIVVALNEQEEHYDQCINAIYTHFLPHKNLIIRRNKDTDLFTLLPYLQELKPIDAQTTVYICYQGVCNKPLTEIKEILQVLSSL